MAGEVDFLIPKMSGSKIWSNLGFYWVWSLLRPWGGGFKKSRMVGCFFLVFIAFGRCWGFPFLCAILLARHRIPLLPRARSLRRKNDPNIEQYSTALRYTDPIGCMFQFSVYL